MAGLKVLDLGHALAGPYAATILADLGADVVKVEDLEALDPIRSYPPTLDGEGHYHLALNRNKRSIGIDLQSPGGAEVLKRLLAWTDVVIDNREPSTLQSAGLNAQEIQDANPALISCHITGFGETKASAFQPGCDIIIQALTGCMDLTGQPGGPPTKMGLPVPELVTGMYAAVGVLAAVNSPERPRAGHRIDITVLDTAVALLNHMAVGYFADGSTPSRLGTGHATIYPYNSFETSDGEVVVAPFTQRFWRNFCQGIEREDLSAVEEYKNFSARLKRKDQLSVILEPILRQRPTAEWVEIFERVDVPTGPVMSIEQTLALPQTVHRMMAREVEAEDGGSITLVGSPFRFEDPEGHHFVPSASRAPRLGENTADVLADAGLAVEDVTRLIVENVVRTDDH